MLKQRQEKADQCAEGFATSAHGAQDSSPAGAYLEARTAIPFASTFPRFIFITYLHDAVIVKRLEQKFPW
jgi:hypothetical protein